MDRSEFERAFRTALWMSSRLAGADASAPDISTVLMFGAGRGGASILVSEAVELPYLGQDEMYRVIDVAVINEDDGSQIGWVAPGGGLTATLADTWDPQKLGPFHVIGEIRRPKGAGLGP